MLGSKADKKNVELVKLIAQLRDHIDIYRIIGLNLSALRNSEISVAFLSYLQRTAQESLAIYFCKIFEPSRRHDLNSIPGIIKSLPPIDIPIDQRSIFSVFGKKYGNDASPEKLQAYFSDTFQIFYDSHSQSLNCLKGFRDTIGAHGDSGAAIDSLPSLAEFETLYSFAVDFYGLVSRCLINSGPAIVPRQAGRGLVRLMESMKVRTLQFDFDVDE